MPESENDPADVIAAYRRRRERMGPLLLGGSSVVLLVVGLLLIVMWFTGDSPPGRPAFLASDTPTPTQTPTKVPPTDTPTITLTPTITETGTPEGPRVYTVQEGDTLFTIAEQFEVDLDLLLAYNADVITDAGSIFVGQEIIIPPPDAERPTDGDSPAGNPGRRPGN